MSDAARKLERLRALRQRPPRDLSIAGMVRRMDEQALHARRQRGRLVDIWNLVIPPELASQATITAFRAGVAQVEVDSAAALFELDRYLRSGGLAKLRHGYRATLLRVKLRQRPEADKDAGRAGGADQRLPSDGPGR